MNKTNPDNICSHLYKEYPYHEEVLNDMLDSQYKLQKHYHKLGRSVDPDSKDIDERIFEAIYNWNNVTVEYFELTEHFINGGDYKNFANLSPDELMEIKFEYIDMWHFLMNIFIYLGLRGFPERNFMDIYDHVREITHEAGENYSVDRELKISMAWNLLSCSWGDLCNNLPYKKWKTYKKKEITQETLMMCVQVLLAFIQFGLVLGIEEEEFYNLYMSKLEENINRQKRGY